MYFYKSRFQFYGLSLISEDVKRGDCNRYNVSSKESLALNEKSEKWNRTKNNQTDKDWR